MGKNLSLKNAKSNDTETPLISVILICLNGAGTIGLTIQSILNLDYPRIEFIVIDGDSNDGTHEILEKYKNNIDTLIIEKDNGVYDAMNKGIKLAKGEFLYFIGSDDIVLNSWNNLTGRLKPGNTIYYGNAYFPISNQIYLGKVSYFKLLTINICQQAIFYPRTVFEKYQFSTD
jgi:glycosyltransferase involved in cell wall biosynthesis